MRPRAIGEESLVAMKELRAAGVSYQTIADRFEVGKKTVLDAFNGRKPPRAVANDNHPDRIRVMSAHNGGCSTTSGYMPVTLRRVPTLEKPLLPCVAMEAANDNGVAPLQVAA